MPIQISSNQIQSNAITSAKLAGSIPASKLDLTQTYDFSSGTLRSGTPSADSDVAVKSYVDGLVGSGVFWKEPVKVASTANIDLSSALVNNATIDGVTVATGDRVLVKDQSSAAENGIYIVASSGAASRASDCDSASELNGAAVFVKQGTAAADQAFVQTAEIANLGSDSVTWVQFTGLGQITAGAALSKTGNTLNVTVDDSSIEVSSDALQIKNSGVTNDMLSGSIANGKLANSTISGVALGTNLNSLSAATNGGVVFSAYNGSASVSNLQLDINDLADAGVSVANDSIAIYDADADVTGKESIAHLIAAVAGDGLADSSGVLSVSVDDSSIELNSDSIRVKASGVTNAMLAGSIADSKLNQITTSDKVAGSAVELNGSGALENNSGLKVKVDTDTIKIGSGNRLEFALNPQFQTLSPNGNLTAFDMSETLKQGFDVIIVIRNGLIMKQVMSGPSDESEYVVDRTGGTGGVSKITFGSAPAGTDDLRVFFFGAAS